MSDNLADYLGTKHGVAPWRLRLAHWVESRRVQRFVISIIILNGIVLGLETDAGIMGRVGPLLKALDILCLWIFTVELVIKFLAFRMTFWRSGWNWFDFAVVAISWTPGAGPLAVLRSLRILRVLRLLTVIPQLRRVIAAFLHSIPGLTGVIAVMAIFFYAMGVLATKLFGAAFPQWFGSLGSSLYSLFQIMTLESWSMGIVRPVMEVFPWAWMFFVPFIVIATFTILNLFIGIIVSTMQELAVEGQPRIDIEDHQSRDKLLERIQNDLDSLKRKLSDKD